MEIKLNAVLFKIIKYWLKCIDLAYTKFVGVNYIQYINWNKIFYTHGMWLCL